MDLEPNAIPWPDKVLQASSGHDDVDCSSRNGEEEARGIFMMHSAINQSMDQWIQSSLIQPTPVQNPSQSPGLPPPGSALLPELPGVQALNSNWPDSFFWVAFFFCDSRALGERPSLGFCLLILSRPRLLVAERRRGAEGKAKQGNEKGGERGVAERKPQSSLEWAQTELERGAGAGAGAISATAEVCTAKISWKKSSTSRWALCSNAMTARAPPQ